MTERDPWEGVTFPTPSPPPPAGMTFLTRLEALSRNTGRCEGCGKSEAHDWQHRQNRSQQGTWAPSNCMMLCRSCHMWVHREPHEAVKLGWMVRSVHEPKNVPVSYWDAGRRTRRWVYLDDHWNTHPALRGSSHGMSD